MKTKIVILLMLSHFMYGQTQVFEIKPGQSIGEVIPDSVLYFSPSFVKSTALLKTGHSGLITLNYSRFFDEMLFIDDSGDTLAISNPDDFVYMKIGETIFYPYKGSYYEEIDQHGDLKLSQRSYFNHVNQKKVGAMGIKDSNTSIDIINTVQAEVGLINLKTNEYMDVKLKTEYFFSDKQNQFKPLTKRRLLSSFKNNKELKAYLSTHKVDFNDITQVYAMLNEIAL